jgi:hypothetical protein
MISIIPLRFLQGDKWVHIRELCGMDEQSVSGNRSIDAICLLDRIIQDIPGTDKGFIRSANLSVSDRYRILTAVFFNTYGPKIETTVSCLSCDNRFDIGFSMDEWVTDLKIGKAEHLNGNEGDFPFKTPAGINFRLPTGEDEMAVMGMEPLRAETELLKRCLPGETENYDADALQHTMQAIAPLVEADLEAECPECSVKQSFHFNLQHYLLSSLLNEYDNLVAEVHLLAKYYGCGLKEILELPRKARRSYVALAEPT